MQGFTLAGSVDDFDAASFKAALAGVTGRIEESDISLMVSSGSVEVEATIVPSTPAAAEEANIALTVLADQPAESASPKQTPVTPPARCAAWLICPPSGSAQAM